MTEAIATLNAGSSSLKFALYEIDGRSLAPVAHGQIEGIGAAPHMVAKDARGAVLTEQRWPAGASIDHEALLGPLLAWIDAHLGEDRLIAIGHRIVHGGAKFSGPVIVDGPVLEALESLSPLAPLHQPHNVAAVRAAMATRPGLPQIACFDTAFHHRQAELITRLPLPRIWYDRGVRRYGFHGLSYEFVAGRLEQLDPTLHAGKVIVAHLGAGASLCAIEGGRSLDSTMGFSTLDGLMMGTRPGAIDPGVLLYLQQQAGLSVDEVQALLYHQSGLLGVSGLSSDMRALLASDDPHAAEAVALFVLQIARQAGALTSTLGGLDGLVFTAGIGENAPEIRAAAVERLAWLGAMLDPVANAAGAGLISAASSRVRVWVIPTDEEAMIARHTLQLVSPPPSD